ncbi:MAG: glycosyl transferase group 1 [Firmicutes bacterium]|nr:glycosyl transferase group 1 [Bacillota bacterium]
MKIALLGYGFVSWNGGCEFIQLCAEALMSKAKTDDLQIYLLIEKQNIKEAEKANSAFGQWLNTINKNIQVVFYGNLLDCLNKFNIEVVIPSMALLGNQFTIPWVGYIYDFQHKYFPHFFSQDEISSRDQYFSDMLLQAKAVIVSSRSVEEDIFKYYPNTSCKIFILPLATKLIPEGWLTQEEDVCKKYCIPSKYFLISNQFWIHKDHLTAFEALAILRKRGNCEVPIVCTGETSDYRFPEYFSELIEKIKSMGMEKQIYILGYIPKWEQLHIMRNAAALLQPTLFEGAPGGAAAREALLLNVPVILSDIPVNKELIDSDVIFFKAGCAEDLADKIEYLLSTDLIDHTEKETLIQKGLKQVEDRGEKLLEAISYAIKTANKDELS